MGEEDNVLELLSVRLSVRSSLSRPVKLRALLIRMFERLARSCSSFDGSTILCMMFVVVDCESCTVLHCLEFLSRRAKVDDLFCWSALIPVFGFGCCESCEKMTAGQQ